MSVEHPATPKGVDDDTRDEALGVLRDLLEWKLPPARWQRVSVAVEALRAVLAAGDPVAVRAAVAELEQCGPVRATRIGTDSPTAPPPEVVDRANSLVYGLGGISHAEPEDAGTDR